MRRLLLIALTLLPLCASAQTTNIVIRKRAAAPVVTAVSVASTATALPTTAATNRVSICIFNNGTVPIYIGPSGVTTSNGLPLAPGAAFCDDVGLPSGTSVAYYGIVASGTAEARVLEN